MLCLMVKISDITSQVTRCLTFLILLFSSSSNHLTFNICINYACLPKLICFLTKSVGLISVALIPVVRLLSPISEPYPLAPFPFLSKWPSPNYNAESALDPNIVFPTAAKSKKRLREMVSNLMMIVGR